MNQYLDALSQQQGTDGLESQPFIEVASQPSLTTLPPSEHLCVDIVFRTLFSISGSRIRLGLC